MRSELGPRHLQTLRALRGLGRWIGESGDPDGAVAAYQEATDGLEQVAGPDHHDTLISWHNLAYWRALAGDVTQATADFHTAATDAERTLGADHPTTLTYRSNLAFWQGVSGDPTAIGTLTTLRHTVETVFGPHHPRTTEAANLLTSWQPPPPHHQPHPHRTRRQPAEVRFDMGSGAIGWTKPAGLAGRSSPPGLPALACIGCP
ncbi:tetratricopeptide repeat protein [Saccharothrix sp. HUAS TT10]|uniref:tetratricopeptide repeat protein n=1 Tax=Saccharothrix sp. HUAS TT10 TaxID=3447450 RepID=UPI003F6E8BDB